MLKDTYTMLGYDRNTFNQTQFDTAYEMFDNSTSGTGGMDKTNMSRFFDKMLYDIDYNATEDMPLPADYYTYY